MASKQAPGKGAAGAMPNPMKAANANNRRALGDIGNLVGDLNTRCNVTKEGVTEKPLPQVTRPVTRSFGAQLLANAQAAANRNIPAANQRPQAQPITTKVEVKAEEKVAWGNKQRRTSKSKDVPSTHVDGNGDDDVVVIEPPPGAKAVGQRNNRNMARKGRGHSLTSTLTARSEGVCGVFDTEMIDVEEFLPNIDEGDLNNQLAVVEYVEDIYKFYRKMEKLSCVPDYMAAQSEINDKMRAILVDWLIEVHLKFELMPETLYLTTNLLDRYLALQTVSRKSLQLVGLTAMLLASKYEEIWAPEINDFVCISDRAYSRDQILAMEKSMLNKLKFNLTVPTPYVFLVRFLKAAGSDKEMENLVFFLIELSLTQYVMVKYAPSILAAAAVYTAQCTLKKSPIWPDLLKRHTGMSEAELMECAGMMASFHRNSAESKLKVVHKKYSGPHFGSVALISPANLPS